MKQHTFIQSYIYKSYIYIYIYCILYIYNYIYIYICVYSKVRYVKHVEHVERREEMIGVMFGNISDGC